MSRPFEKNTCSYCGSTEHTSLMCFNKPRSIPRAISKKTLSKRQICNRQWFADNPPDERGRYFCYLRISPRCEKVITRSTMNLEHTKSKTRYPQYSFEPKRLLPACQPCNKLKGSKDLEEFVDEFPHLQLVIDHMRQYD